MRNEKVSGTIFPPIPSECLCTFIIILLFRSTVKRPCDGRSGHMTMRTASTDVRRPPPPLGQTVFSREIKNPRPGRQPLQSSTSKANHAAYLRALKEQFQRDIDDTVAQILSEGVCQYVSCMVCTCICLVDSLLLCNIWYTMEPLYWLGLRTSLNTLISMLIYVPDHA